MMNEIERAEMEAELNGREDYLREAFGSEAEMLAKIDEDEHEMAWRIWRENATPEEIAEHDAALAAERASLAEYHAQISIEERDEIPF